jgi:hypothetical protein
MLDDPRLRAGATVIGRKLETEDGVEQAVTLIEQL